MGELIHQPGTPDYEMCGEGESLIAYTKRLGAQAVSFYSEALARYRERLAQDKGISLDELHNGPLAGGNTNAEADMKAGFN